jgi:hypothetical protein
MAEKQKQYSQNELEAYVQRANQNDVEIQRQVYEESVSLLGGSEDGTPELTTLAEILRIYHTSLNGQLKRTKPENQPEIFAKIQNVRQAELILLHRLAPRMLNGAGISWEAEFDQDWIRTLQHVGQIDEAVNLLNTTYTALLARLDRFWTLNPEGTQPTSRSAFVKEVQTRKGHDDEIDQFLGDLSARPVLEMRKAENVLRVPEVAKENNETALGLMMQALIHAQEYYKYNKNVGRVASISSSTIEKSLRHGAGKNWREHLRAFFQGSAELTRVTVRDHKPGLAVKEFGRAVDNASNNRISNNLRRAKEFLQKKLGKK